MVNWHDPAELQRESLAYVNVIFACFGLYIWEVFQTSEFELSILQRRRRVRWHWVLFLFICRYSLILSIVALMSSYTVKSPINCQALYTFICVTGNLSIICASTTLMFRTVALWQRKLPITIVLGVFCLAHWALLFRGMFIMKATYNAAAFACSATTSSLLFLGVTYWATLGFNLILLIFYVVGLMRRDHGATMWEMLFEDGVVCYLIAFSCNAPPAILSAINLSPIMDLICTVPAAVLTAMAACRTVTHLKEIGESDDVYVHSSTQLTVPRPPGANGAFRVSSRYPPRPEVHVTTDHIVMQDFDPSPSTAQDMKSPSLTESASDDKSAHAV